MGKTIYSTLIDCKTLIKHLDDKNWILVDCRFSLQDIDCGIQAYKKEHIPGAVYAHLDLDLCGHPGTDNGRHPLPTPDVMVKLFGKLGINRASQVVVYDDTNGSIAARLWWMLNYMGHSSAAVLDGGWHAWKEAGFSVREGVEKNEPAQFTGSPNDMQLVTLSEVATIPFLIDSRAPERHRGQFEPIDPKAGHIPGSLNYFYQQNWGDDGFYLPKEELKEKFVDIIGSFPVEEVTFYCGSGVTACVNLLALKHSGLGTARLYVGSWGEWCRNPDLPIATGG